MKRIPELDGLRALAILPVLFAHSLPIEHSRFHVLAAYGWVGVDLFFVLSGFLITGILLDSKGGSGYFRNFYARRVLRIWPVYFGLLFIVLKLIPHFRPETHDLAGFPSWYYVLFLQNLFPLPQFVPVLAPTWSLGVEEQFYLVWPLLISLLPKRVFAVVITIALIASPFLRLITVHLTGDWSYVYVATYCRADGLLIGAALACWMRSESFSLGRLLRVGRWAVLLSIGPIAWIFTRGIAERGQQSILIYTLLAIAFGGVIARALSPAATTWSRFLRFSFLQYLGKISYGLYLLHKLAFVVYDKSPLYAAFSFAGHQRLNMVIAFAAEVTFAILAASLSWYLFETPVLKLKKHFETPGKQLLSAAGAAATV